MRRLNVALIVAIAVTVGGAWAASANAAKPQLWLTEEGVIQRPGTLFGNELPDVFWINEGTAVCGPLEMLMKLQSNGRSTDTFVGVGSLTAGPDCGQPEMSTLSGDVESVAVSVTGHVVMKFSPKVTIKYVGGIRTCTYTFSKLEGTIPIPGELKVQELVGPAKMVRKLSQPGCEEAHEAKLIEFWPDGVTFLRAETIE